VEITLATPDDYAGILALQGANYLPNLPAREREGGFLSAQFTRAQLASIADDLGIVVAKSAGDVVAYVCAHRATLTPLPPVVAAMIRCAREASFRGSALAAARLFVYGPVCIAGAHRGRGLLRRLYGAVRAAMAGEFDFGITLVSDDNAHSLRAHVAGLGMDDLRRFEHDGRAYHLLAFPVNGQELPLPQRTTRRRGMS
jgi:hypothetical protein